MDPLQLWGIAWAQCTIILPGLQHNSMSKKALLSKQNVKHVTSLVTAALTITSIFFTDISDGFLTGVVTLAVFFYCTRANEVAFEDDLHKLSQFYKSAHVGCSFHDIRAKRPIIGSISSHVFDTLIKLLVHIVIIVLSMLTIKYLPVLSLILFRPIVLLAAVTAGVSYLYAFLQALDAIIGLAFTFSGDKFPPIMNNIFSSTSIQEFWSRWDTVVQQVLKKKVFKPLVHQYGVSKSSAAIFTFLASGFLHMYPLIVIGLEFLSALSMFSFFGLQILLISFESIYLRNLPNYYMKAWTFTSLLTTATLFVLPVLKIIEVDF